MRRYQKKMAEEFITTLFEAHDEVKKYIKKRDYSVAMSLLGQCQDSAIRIGGIIEESEGEEFPTISLLEEYCELIFQIYEAVQRGAEPSAAPSADKIFKPAHKKLVQVQNSVKNDIEGRIEAVFLPYKASMWDSLESVWQAADADPLCDAFVIPIPYYDRNPDGSAKQEHWEGEQFPTGVPITHYNSYDIARRKPDLIFIHNPYDDENFVTSVHPLYYSRNLKQHTEQLVYIPYYTTSGGMSESRGYCSAYYNVDYIIMQAESYRQYFDPKLPQDKLVALGSPKFDRTVRLCNDPPEPPASWKAQMDGKKVYFYNTSISGMLADTEQFLKKMQYVFHCFEGRKDACILWRPHPLLESTFDSMRPEYKAEYEAIKRDFIDRKLGIYDDTPDMNNTIALSDVYIGDGGSSLTSLFGVAGKPVFILNNRITTEPEEDDWRGEIIKNVAGGPGAKWMLTQGNKVYYSPNNDYHYEFYCDLSEYARGEYYASVVEYEGKLYALPRNAGEILVIKDRDIYKRIELQPCGKRSNLFYSGFRYEHYLILLPDHYPAVVRYDLKTGKIMYITEHLDVHITENEKGERCIGALAAYGGWLFLTSPIDTRVLAIRIETGEVQVLTTGAAKGGYASIPHEGFDMWLMPQDGNCIVRWNPMTGDVREYTEFPDGFKCINPQDGSECMKHPFSMMIFHREYAYLTPSWANMYVRIHKETGRMEEWAPPFETPVAAKNEYYPPLWMKGFFLRPARDEAGHIYGIFSAIDRRVYNVNLKTNEYEEVPIVFDREELMQHEPGFQEDSELMQYMCQENAFNSLLDLLNDDVTGNAFDRERQLKAFQKINAVTDGTSGDKIYGLIRSKL